MTRNCDILFTSEYIKNVLYFATVRQGKVLKSTSDVHYFCIDNDLIYENYYSDFGPLNLGCVYKYCNILNEKLKQYLNKQTIVHYTTIDPKKKANAAFLLGCYGVLYLNLSPRDALKPLMHHGQSYRPFQDATQGESNYTISLMDCVCALKKAHELDFFNFQDFNHEEYERLDKIQGGDLNWIVPGKFLAFIGPVDYSVSLYHPPEMYIEYFKDNNVNIVIRLNKRMYDADVFNNAGITHYDLFFPDGSCPPRHILMKFLQISEDSGGAMAVHCKAGLGRTGSLIGCYLIKHYRMSAHEAIGWMRICRPGSVIGHQQGWLEHLEPWLIKQGNLYRKRMFQDAEKFPIHEFGVYSINERIMRQQPVVFNKNLSIQSPVPVMQRQTRSDIAPSSRANGSKLREDEQTNEEEEFLSEVDLTSNNKESAERNFPKNSALEQSERNIHEVIPIPMVQRESFWKKFFCCNTRGEDLFWRLAVCCACIIPKKLNSSKCCDFCDRVTPCKPTEAEQYEWRLRNKTSNNSKISNRGFQHGKDGGEVIGKMATRRGSGAGEPRVAPAHSTSRSSTDRSMPRPIPFQDPIPVPLPTFRTTQGPLIKTLTDAKNYLMKSSMYNQQREKTLKSSVIVTPFRNAGQIEHRIMPTTSPSAFCSGSRGQAPQQRRRLPLGRSPSPSPSPSPTRFIDHSRATNTNSAKIPPVDKYSKDRSALRDALSGLRLYGCRAGGSIGAASVGAASLGACRDAPSAKRAPSVRSDERPLATQGDMLNSIKFQRRFRDLNSEKISNIASERMRNTTLSNLYNSKVSSCTKDKPPAHVETRVDSRGSSGSGWRPAPSNYSGLREKCVSSTSKFYSPPRPTSPKGRTRPSFY